LISTLRIATPGGTELVVVALAFTAGFADGDAYLRWHLFAANMTGNTVLLGIALAGLDVPRALAVLGAIAAFIAGSFAGESLASRSRPGILFTEAVVLAVAAAIEDHPVQLECIAFAMGLQNTAFSNFDGVAANTAFITGNYARVAQAFVSLGRPEKRAVAWRTIAIISSLIASYALGAAAITIALKLGVRHSLALVAVVALLLALWSRSHEKPTPVSAG